jgi:hypothetical protein
MVLAEFLCGPMFGYTALSILPNVFRPSSFVCTGGEAASGAPQSFPVNYDPEAKLRDWVEANYVHIPPREKDFGTKLMSLYAAYTTTVPPVHARMLGKTTFGKMLAAVFPNIGPHVNSTRTVNGLYLLRPRE